MRDDRPADAFAWVRPWVPYGDDPFVWYDPSEDMKRAAEPANDGPAPERPNERPRDRNDGRRQRPAAAEAAPVVARTIEPAGDDVEMWVELPAIEDRPKRARRPRGRGRGAATTDAVGAEVAADGVTEAPAADDAPVAEAAPVADEVAPAPVVAEEAAAPVKKPRSRSRKTAAPVEAAPEPTVAEVVAFESAPDVTPEPEAPPPAPKAPDPAEISAPPTAPRKGWWRRG